MVNLCPILLSVLRFSDLYIIFNARESQVGRQDSTVLLSVRFPDFKTIKKYWVTCGTLPLLRYFAYSTHIEGWET